MDGICINTRRTYTCTCQHEFIGNGRNCLDVDECLLKTDNCHEDTTCLNTYGKFQCICNNGFLGNSISCIDLGECIVTM